MIIRSLVLLTICTALAVLAALLGINLPYPTDSWVRGMVGL